jgi:hypothetical protein
MNVFSQETEHLAFIIIMYRRKSTYNVNAFQHRFSIKLWTGILGDSLASVDKQTIIR